MKATGQEHWNTPSIPAPPTGMVGKCRRFSDPATIVIWDDGTKTVVKCMDGDVYSEETGLAMAICKKAYGNDNSFHKVFKKWVVVEETEIDWDKFIESVANMSLGMRGKKEEEK